MSDEKYDAFGRPIERTPEDAEPIAAAPAPPAEQRGGFLSPTEAGTQWTLPAPPASEASPSAGPLADYGERVIAALVDFLVRAAIVIVVTLVAAGIGAGNDDAAGIGVLLAVYLIAPLYAPIVMSRWEGQTVGHKVVGTRIVTRAGAPVTGGKAFVREFLTKNVLVEGIGGLFTLGILPLLNYLWPLWDDRNEALHDKMCDTRVVKA